MAAGLIRHNHQILNKILDEAGSMYVSGKEQSLQTGLNLLETVGLINSDGCARWRGGEWEYIIFFPQKFLGFLSVCASVCP